MRKALVASGQANCRRDGCTSRHSFRVLQQADLHSVFGFEPRKQAAFQHAHSMRQHAERDALQPALAHQREALSRIRSRVDTEFSYLRRIARQDLSRANCRGNGAGAVTLTMSRAAFSDVSVSRTAPLVQINTLPWVQHCGVNLAFCRSRGVRFVLLV